MNISVSSTVDCPELGNTSLISHICLLLNNINISICKKKCVKNFCVDPVKGLDDDQVLSINGNNIKCLVCK